MFANGEKCTKFPHVSKWGTVVWISSGFGFDLDVLPEDKVKNSKMWMFLSPCFSSEDELDVLLNGTPEQKKKLIREYLTGESESSSGDEFEKEMEAELSSTIKTMEETWGPSSAGNWPAISMKGNVFDGQRMSLVVRMSLCSLLLRHLIVNARQEQDKRVPEDEFVKVQTLDLLTDVKSMNIIHFLRRAGDPAVMMLDKLSYLNSHNHDSSSASRN